MFNITEQQNEKWFGESDPSILTIAPPSSSSSSPSVSLEVQQSGIFGMTLNPKKPIQAREPMNGIPIGLESIADKRTFLFQIDRVPTTIRAQVFKSYNVFGEDGTRLFYISNRIANNNDTNNSWQGVTELEVVGHNGEPILSFLRAATTWGQNDCCWCFPAAHESDGIEVYLEGIKIGEVKVKTCQYKPFVFFGCKSSPKFSQYHDKYTISYKNGTKSYKMSTRKSDNYGLKIFNIPKKEYVGEIKLTYNANTELNLRPTADFVLEISENYEDMPLTGKAVLIALAIRHQMNVILIHHVPPLAYKYKL